MIPRIIDGDEWVNIESGLKQRICALNMFIDDVYNDKRIIKEGVVPEALIYSSKTYRKQCEGLKPPNNVWCHVNGTDLVRDRDGAFYVLEDNLRCPSGVSYVLTNRDLMKRTFARVFQGMSVTPVATYAENLLRTLIGERSGEHAHGSQCRPAHAGNLQFGLLRTHVSRTANGDRIGGRIRFGRARRLRAYEDHTWAATGRCYLPPHRRRLSRPGRVSRGFGAWRERIS